MVFGAFICPKCIVQRRRRTEQRKFHRQRSQSHPRGATYNSASNLDLSVELVNFT